VLVCRACGDESPTGRGWRAYVTDFEAEPELGIFCENCTEREFDPTPWHDPEDA